MLGGPLRNAVQGSAAVMWSSAADASAAFSESGLFVSEGALARENFALKERVAQLQALAQENAVLREENEALRALADVPEGEAEGLAVPVVSGADSSLYGTFLIGAGSKEGVIRGARVFAPGRVLLGIVSDVSEGTALVQSLLAGGVKTEGLIASSTSIIVSGRGSGNGIARVPRDTPVAVGDPVYYRDVRAIIGVVGAIESVPSSAEKQVYLRVPQNLNSLRFVTILPPL